MSEQLTIWTSASSAVTVRSTQKNRLWGQLLQAGKAGICIQDIAQVRPFDVLTARNRIGELRKDGRQIESAPCKVHKHRAPVSRYWLA